MPTADAKSDIDVYKRQAYCYDGKTYETIKEMAEEYGIERQRIYSFRRRGWSLEDVMQMCVNDVRGRGRLFEYNGKLYRSTKAGYCQY